MENKKEILHILDHPQDVVILSHRNPDGDALGSSLAMYLFLRELHHSVKVIFPSEFPTIFSWMPGSENILIYDLDQDNCKSAIEKASLIICLDFSSLDRIDKMAEFVINQSCYKITIDHHLDPEPFSDFLISDITASSTSEIIFDFISELKGISYIKKDIASCIYTGIVTDTGSFKYATSAKLFRIVAELIDAGVEDYNLQNWINNCLEEKYLRLLGYCLYEKMEILPESRTALIALNREDYIKFDIQRGDTEGIVNYLLMMKDIDIAALITEQPTIIKLSLRSKGDISVQEICRDHFKGGGHKNASGGAVYGSLAQTVKKFKEIVPKYFKNNNQNIPL
ncbi:MAG TPA: DHH family phosphoesterase [Saprospiraceae bacterium]|nr:DHH family phosphoesterase [Saprospiraceae bacterium]